MEMSRRSFLGTIAAGISSFAVAKPFTKLNNKLVSYINPPKEPLPGRWAFYASTCRECPAGCGMKLWHRDGRITKAQGLRDHPLNRGGLCPRGQASVQGVYDPDRVKAPCQMLSGHAKQISWEMAIQGAQEALRSAKPGRILVVSNLQTGSLASLMNDFARSIDARTPLFWEPLHVNPIRDAHRILYGRPVVPRYRLDQCTVLFSFSADFLETWISPVEFAREYAEIRSLKQPTLCRSVYFGPRLSMTAANTDSHVMITPGSERWAALHLARIIMDKDWAKDVTPAIRNLVNSVDPADLRKLHGIEQTRLEKLAYAFVSAPHSVALPGPLGTSGPVAVDTAIAVTLLNHVAGRIGASIDLDHPHALSSVADDHELERAIEDISADDVVLLHEVNIAFSRPALASKLRKAKSIIYLGTMSDETAEISNWVLPVDSYLENIGDYEPYKGLVSFIQPTMERVFDTRPAGDVLLALSRALGKPLATDFNAWHKSFWTKNSTGSYDAALERGGFLQDVVSLANRNEALSTIDYKFSPPEERVDKSRLTLWVWPTIMLYDGQLSNRGWLQETPEPVSALVWGTTADIHPSTALSLGLSQSDEIEIDGHNEEKTTFPVRITNDVAPDVIAVSFGQGHTALGKIARGVGANAFLLIERAPKTTLFGQVKVRRTGRKGQAFFSRAERDQHEREIVQWVELDKVRRMPPGSGNPLIMPLPEGYDPKRDVYPKREYKEHRWAMVIDLQRCIGCGACTVACYAENNLGVMGGEQVAKGREMTWLKVVRYQNDAEEGERRLGWIPMLCQHCDAAPCEPVCPVFAAVHNDEGLNAQVYNRCIGTRYCSNNCPYKVRRFNFLNVDWRKPLDRQLNPEVTVRTRGVMEKCTFCIQRIRAGEIRAKLEKRPVRDGDIEPACVDSCPTSALVFGDLMDAESRVTKATRLDPRRYHVLEDLNTKPGVTYLKKIKQKEIG